MKILTILIIGLVLCSFVIGVSDFTDRDYSLQKEQTKLVKDWWEARDKAISSEDYNKIKLDYVLKLKQLRRSYGK